MKCPYCAEEIKDEALVCRYCRQNLMGFKLLTDRISGLEEQVSEVAASLQQLQTSLATKPLGKQPAEIPKETNQTIKRSKYVLAVLLPVLSALAIYWPFRLGGGYFYRIYDWLPVLLIISISCPLPFGVWFGLSIRGTHLKAYAIIGIIVGIMSAISMHVIFVAYSGYMPSDWLGVSLRFILAGALLYIAGGLIGDWIEKKSSPIAESSYAVRLARKIVGEKGKSPAGISRVKRLAEIIGALAPILTFVGSLIAAYLSYKAAMVKK